MTKDQVLQEIKEKMGIVPGFFQIMPEASIAAEWTLFKRAVLVIDSELDPKVRELVGIGVAAARGCKYCTYFHCAAAKLYGATDAEIREAAELAGFGGRWSGTLNGIRYDYEQFVKEVEEVGAHLNKQKAAALN